MFTSSKVKSVNQIYKTKDYNLFNFRPDNRPVIQSHVKELMDSMIKHGWEQGSYVVVNEKMEVIDGQHRLMSGMELGLPIIFTIEKGSNFDTIQTLNTKQKNWTKYNHIEGFVKKGNQNYIILNEYMKKFPEFKLTEMLMFLGNTQTNISKDVFEEGGFEVRSTSIADMWINNLISLKGYFPKYYNKSIFVRSVLRVMKKKDFVFSEFLHKVKLRPNNLVACGTVDQYVEMIENIYNYKRSNKINLRF
jgi:hypothetical protein